jgi:hypothetical protein
VDRNEQDSNAVTLSEQVRRVRQYWWLVAVVVALAVLAAVASTARTPTTYTARSASMVSSNNRSPDQDAVLVLGYVDYFNGAPYQNRLSDEGKLAHGVTATASAAAASPIMLIDATAGSAAEAQTAARTAARAFRHDINYAHDQASSREINAIQREVAALQSGQPPTSGAGAPMTPQARTSAINDLKDRILFIQADKTNVLAPLELNGGVSSQSPSLWMNLLFALAGGLVVGVLLALLASRLSPRVRTREDLAWKVGADLLVELPQPGNALTSGQFWSGTRQLGNLVRARLDRPGVVAVTQPRTGSGSAVLAWALAQQWAEQGNVTVLVRTDGAAKPVDAGRTALQRPAAHHPEAALSPSVRDAMTSGPVRGMWVLDEAACAADSGSCLGDVLAEVVSFAAFVVVEAPAVLDAADAQLACAAAGRTVLVVETATAKAKETADALSLLSRTGCGPLGAVLLHTSRRGPAGAEVPAYEAARQAELQHVSAG